MVERLVVDEPVRLLAFLRQRFPGWKRSTLEQRIRAGCVRVNGTTLATNDVLRVGDEVQVEDRANAEPARSAAAGVKILWSDEHLIAIDKPSGLLSVSTDRERERTALAIVREHFARARRGARLWPVHRLDRETSGVLLLARSSTAAEILQSEWDGARKHYLALVEGRPSPPSGVIDEPLIEDERLFVRVSRANGSKAARTRYRTLSSSDSRTLLEVELETGRKHQIRAHFAWLGTPIVGDARYGSSGAKLGLHALRLEVRHPFDRRPLTFEAPPPRWLRAASSPDPRR